MYSVGIILDQVIVDEIHSLFCGKLPGMGSHPFKDTIPEVQGLMSTARRYILALPLAAYDHNQKETYFSMVTV